MWLHLPPPYIVQHNFMWRKDDNASQKVMWLHLPPPYIVQHNFKWRKDDNASQKVMWLHLPPPYIVQHNFMWRKDDNARFKALSDHVLTKYKCFVSLNFLFSSVASRLTRLYIKIIGKIIINHFKLDRNNVILTFFEQFKVTDFGFISLKQRNCFLHFRKHGKLF